MITWAEAYFDHYKKNLGDARRRDVFEIDGTQMKVQILAYKNVFPNTLTFCSIGLSSFSDEVSAVAELMVVVDEGWEYMPSVLAQAVSYMVTKPMKVGWGFAISGDARINPNFYKRYGKDALYFTHPMGLPDEFYSVTKSDSNNVGEIYMGIPISRSELDLFKKLGADKFESFMQKEGVDPFSMLRGSAV